MKQFSVPVLAFRSAGVPAVSLPGESKIYFDSSAGALMVSNDGGEWLPLGEGDINTYITNNVNNYENTYVEALHLSVASDGYQVSSDTVELNFSSAFALVNTDGYVTVDIIDTEIGVLASAVACDTDSFDGYLLTAIDTNVHSALITLGNEVSRYSTVHDIAYSAVINIDFAGSKLLEIDQLTGSLQLTTSNLARGQGVTVRFAADGTNRSLTLPAWKFFGAVAPTEITANKTGVLALLAWGATDAEVDAVWTEEA